jgi:RNA polymerase sigma factor (sigma-70 family)
MTSVRLAPWVAAFGSAVVCASSDSSGPFFERPASSRHTDDQSQVADVEASEHTATIGGVPVAALLSRLGAGDSTALATIHETLHVPLWRFAVMLTGITTVADDVVQEIFVSLWMRRESLDPNLDLRAYLYRALRNQVRLGRRHERVITRTEQAVDHRITDVPALGQSMPAPDDAVEAAEFSEAFQRALVALEERERLALHLRIDQELTFQEIGALLGVSKMGAHKIVGRAEEKVRALLEMYRP